MGRLVKIDDSKRGAAVYQSTVTAPRTTASTAPTAAPRTVSGTEAAKSLQASIDAVRKSRNHSFERSGKTRDAYDSSVRSSYQQRQQGLLEQATADYRETNKELQGNTLKMLGIYSIGKALDKDISQSETLEGLVQRQDELQRQKTAMLAENPELKDPGALERIGKTVSGAIKQWGASNANSAATQYAAGSERRNTETDERLKEAQEGLARYQKLYQEALAEGDPNGDAGNYKNMIDHYQRQVDAFQQVPEAQQGAARESMQLADTLAASGAGDIQRAKQGAGKFGQTMVDVGAAGTQMAADMLAGKALGTKTSVPMMFRSFGGAAQEARQDGATIGEQMAYGAASAAVSGLTEQLSNVSKLFKGAFGKGVADDLVDTAIDKAVKRFAATEGGKAILRSGLQLGASAAGEGFEEMVEDIVNPMVKLIYQAKGQDPYGILSRTYAENFDLEETLYDGLIGAAMGLIGGTPEAIKSSVQGIRGNTESTGGYNPDAPADIGQIIDDVRAKGAQTNPAMEQVLDSVNEVVNGQKNSAQQNMDVEINTNPAEHTPEQQRVIEEFQASKDNVIVEFINKWRGLKNQNYKRKIRIPIAEVNERTAADIQSLLGLDVSGYEHALSGGALAHIERRHGTNGQADHSMSNTDNIARMGYVLENYDSVTQMFSKNGKPITSGEYLNADKKTPAPLLQFAKRVDGTYYVVEAVPDTAAKQLRVVSAYMTKADGVTQAPNAQGPGTTPYASPASSPSAVSESTGQLLNMANAPQLTSQTPNGANTSATESIPQSQAQYNPNFNQNQGRDTGSPESVGAAEAGFDASLYNRWVNNAEKLHEPGERPVRNASLPTENLAGQQTMKTGQTIMEAGATPDGRVETIENMYLDGALAYTPQVDAELAANAEQVIEHKGWQTALNDWTAEVRRGKVKPDLVAMGAQLLNSMGNSDASAAQYADLVADYSMLLHNAGQSLQAARILKTLTPEGRLYCLQRSIDSINEQIKKESGIELDSGLMDQFRAAETDEARDAVLDRMKQDVADKMPSTLADKWMALRYVNMLGNFKTQGRNLIGNVGMGGLRAIKDKIGAGLEAAVDKLSGGKLERTKSGTVGREWMKAATDDFATVEDAARGNGRLQEGSPNQMMQDINDRRTIFKNNGNWGTTKDSNAFVRGVRKATDVGWSILEGYRKLTNWATDAGDVVFIKHHYARALAGYLKANGIKVEAFLEGNVDTELLERARSYAIREAQEATFHDNNAFSNWVSKVGRRQDTPKAVKAIAEGVAPFRKTPANVLVRAYEYSPLGFIDTIAKGIQTKKGNATASDVINSAARSLTGTGLLVLGMALRATGNLTAAPDEDDREIDDLLNRQDYAITIGGHSYTMDWLSPMMLPVFMGGVLEDIRQEKELTWSDLDNVIGRFGDPILNMSMLSGVDNALNSVKYSDNGLLQLAASFGLSYLTQGLTNSMLGQIERSTEKNRMTTYTDPTSSVPSWLQQAAGKASAKIPGWDYNQTEYLDEFGRTESNGSLPLRLFENIISPGYHSKSHEGEPVYSEMQRIYEETGQTPFPSASAPKKIKVNKQDYTLSQEQREQYQKTLGGLYYDTMNEAAGMELYRDMTGEERAEFAADVKELATAVAQTELRESFGLEYENSVMDAAYRAAQGGASVPEYLAFRVLYDQAIQERKDAGESYSERAESAKIIEQMAGLSDEAKSALWETKNGDDDPDTIDERNPYMGTLAAHGVAVEDIIYLEEKYKEYQNLKDGDKPARASDQAAELSKWLDGQDFNDTQRKYIDEMYQYSWRNPASPTPYNRATMTKSQGKMYDTWGKDHGYEDVEKFLKYYNVVKETRASDEYKGYASQSRKDSLVKDKLVEAGMKNRTEAGNFLDNYQ